MSHQCINLRQFQATDSLVAGKTIQPKGIYQISHMPTLYQTIINIMMKEHEG